MSLKPEFDSGLTRKIETSLRRTINRDGSYNVHRKGQSWQAFHPWLHVVNMSWPGFIFLVGSVYMAVNFSFAVLYFLMGPGSVHGSAADTEFHRFLNCFFFSGHTLTTVGYGTLAPVGIAANLTATLEALVGLLAFAIITGLLVTRASKPSARIEFSRNALIAPFENGRGLMFRVANQRSNNLMELEAVVILVQVVPKNGAMERRIEFLNLERAKIQMFPLTWTMVHPIVETSPLWGATREDLLKAQTEIIVLMKGFDETFSQIVHTRFSYRAEELVWDAKFIPAFEVTPEGDYILDLDQVSAFRPVERQ